MIDYMIQKYNYVVSNKDIQYAVKTGKRDLAKYLNQKYIKL